MYKLIKSLKISLLMPVLILVSLGAATVTQAGLVEFSVSGTPTVGSTFEVDILVSSVFDTTIPNDAVLTYGFDVATSDSSIFSYIGATVAAPFTDFSQQISDTDVAAATFPGLLDDGTNDTVFLATLVFEALSAGSAELSIFSNLTNANQGLGYLFGGIFDLTSSMSIDVAGQVVPEPSTLLLFAVGVLGMISVRRKIAA